MKATWAKRLSVLAMGGLVMAAPGADGASARSPDRSVVRLSCPDVGGKALCDAMEQAIAFSAPGKVIRRVARGDEQPTATGDVGVSFVITDHKASQVSARLDLHLPGAAAKKSGPDVNMNLSLEDTRKLAEALIASSPHVTSALR
ncbi:hypothetical protein [uncultured Litoreibacter sp.]|uniref:hypothetical protein n=1 Tax=uncultured Litoreibacter sp. TaxID=1392394 RepID=UPI00260A23EA|nr:hypothetical protein [uncultured Litoreibacter sp.]